MIKNIVGNPPFQDNTNRGKTQHKIWIDFTKKMLNDILDENGYIGWVTPSSFLSPSNKILQFFKEYDCIFISFDTNQFFKKENNEPGISMAHYVIHKSRNKTITHVIKNTKSFKLKIDENTLYLPNDLNENSCSIHQKVIILQKNFYDLKYDYVTCHNIQLKTKKINCPISKVETDIHIYPLLHTNPQTWYSSIQQDCFNKKKVMWTRSGETTPFYNDGNLGITDMGYYIEVDSEKNGLILEHNLNLKLFKYIFNTAKWSGFGNEKIFERIPILPNVKMTDTELYDYFKLSYDEVEYLESYLENKIKKNKIPEWYSDNFKYGDDFISMYSEYVRGDGYMVSIGRDSYRIKKTAEVFTPTDNVIDVLMQMNQVAFQNNETFLDPSCGDGQFLSEVVIRKMERSGCTLEQALSTTYGVELMEDNAKLCKERLAGPNPTQEILDILDKNIVCADALTYHYRFDGTHPTSSATEIKLSEFFG